MKIINITNNINKHRSSIITKLVDNNYQHFKYYFAINEGYIKNDKDFNKQFKSIFCRFYILNGARGLSESQKNKYFQLLSVKENNLEKILKVLYDIPGYGNTHKLFLSFGTKLLHTINNRLPIYDSNIASVLELSPQTYPVSLEERIINRIKIYQELKSDFDILLSNKKIINYLKSIRQELRKKAEFDNFNWQDKYISDVKLLDSLLWALHSVLEKN